MNSVTTAYRPAGVEPGITYRHLNGTARRNGRSVEGHTRHAVKQLTVQPGRPAHHRDPRRNMSSFAPSPPRQLAEHKRSVAGAALGTATR
jgi:hypothetical protein